MTKRICDLPPKLVGEKILTKVPITSLREVRSTCKLWDRLSKDWILGKAAAARPHQFLGFMTMDFKVCSLRFDLGGKEDDEEEEDLVLSIKQVDLLSQVEIERVFHCDGLLLCVARGSSRLVVWNPYLGQTRWIAPRTYFHSQNYSVNYAVGYDMNRNHKILMFWDDYDRDGEQLFGLEIYDLPSNSNSWRRVLEFRPDWEVEGGHRGVSLKGNTYFWAHEKGVDYDYDDFLLCFDFTTERFGQRLRLPFHSWNENVVTLSSVRDEKLAVLHQKGVETIEALEIWITTKIEPNDVTWSKFMNVDMRPLIGDRDVRFDQLYGSFFIDEEEKVAVVFDVDGYEFAYELIKTAHYHTAFIIGDDGYYKTVSLGEAPNIWKPLPGSIYCYPTNYTPQFYSPPLVCSSSYLPSLVQLNQPRKRKERHEC